MSLYIIIIPLCVFLFVILSSDRNALIVNIYFMLFCFETNRFRAFLMSVERGEWSIVHTCMMYGYDL